MLLVSLSSEYFFFIRTFYSDKNQNKVKQILLDCVRMDTKNDMLVATLDIIHDAMLSLISICKITKMLTFTGLFFSEHIFIMHPFDIRVLAYAFSSYILVFF